MKATFKNDSQDQTLIAKTEIKGWGEVDWYLCDQGGEECIVARYGNHPTDYWMWETKDLVFDGSPFMMMACAIIGVREVEEDRSLAEFKELKDKVKG